MVLKKIVNSYLSFLRVFWVFFTKWLKKFFSKLIFGWILRVSHVADTFKVEQTQKYVICARNYAKM